VVCSTLAGTLSHNLASLSFDLAVVDEAAQVRRCLAPDSHLL